MYALFEQKPADRTLILNLDTSIVASKHKKNPSKYLATKKRHDRIQEILKSDGLGSKRWMFYPRVKNQSEPAIGGTVAGTRDNVDQRVKVGIFITKVDNFDDPLVKFKKSSMQMSICWSTAMISFLWDQKQASQIYKSD